MIAEGNKSDMSKKCKNRSKRGFKQKYRRKLSFALALPYYALVRMQTKDGTFPPSPHQWDVEEIMGWKSIAQDKRDGEY
jgi:hypothetical protein